MSADSPLGGPPSSNSAMWQQSSIVAANWDSLVFDLGSDPLRRVPMMEPLRGNAELVDTLLAQCQTPTDLLEQLGS